MYIQTQEINRALRAVISAMGQMSKSLVLIQALTRDYSAQLRRFLAVGKEAEEGALRKLSTELDQKMSQIANLRRLNEASVKAARDSVTIIQRGPYDPQIGSAMSAVISSACEFIVDQIDTIGASVKKAGNQLQFELEELFEASLLHDDAEPEFRVIAEALLRTARYA
jgi:hypothetical protein